MNVIHLTPDNPAYPRSVENILPDRPAISAIGNLDLLQGESLALVCSIKCPGNAILRTYDLIRALRDAGIPTIGGFHTPMEKECLDLLLRGSQPVIACPARGIEGMRLPPTLSLPLESGHLLLLSPFKARDRRPTAALAGERNRFVAALASEVFVAYATEGGKTEQLCREVVESKRPVFTFDAADNARLAEIGVQPISSAMLLQNWAGKAKRSCRTISPAKPGNEFGGAQSS